MDEADKTRDKLAADVERVYQKFFVAPLRASDPWTMPSKAHRRALRLALDSLLLDWEFSDLKADPRNLLVMWDTMCQDSRWVLLKKHRLDWLGQAVLAGAVNCAINMATGYAPKHVVNAVRQSMKSVLGPSWAGTGSE